MDSNLSRNNKRGSIIISHRPNKPRARRALRLAAASLYQQTATTVEPTKEEVTIEMDDCIVSNWDVSTTKMKSDSDADNVPVSVSEEEEAQMESEEEEKDSKAAPTPTIEGEEPFVSPPVDEEDNNDEEDNDDGADEEDVNDEDEEDTDVDEEEDIFDFNLNDIDGMSEYELMRLQRVHRNNARLASLGLLAPMTSATTLSSDRSKRKKRAVSQDDVVRCVQPKRNAKLPTSYKDLDDHVILLTRKRRTLSARECVRTRTRRAPAEATITSMIANINP
jgi:hypothetical protein